jgi:dTDP-4-amino-4,6-dideoxygalactose transaminase
VIRLTIPSIDAEDLEAVQKAVSSGFLVQGQRVAAFEQTVADYVGTKYAIAVSNCTAALHLALLALDVRPGDLVVVTTYSWIATANVIELCGAQPVFVDIQPDTFNMSPEHLDETLKHLQSNAKTSSQVKAILPVHTFGQMANMSTIMALAEHYDVPVIEDAACALGAKWDGRQAGTWGKMGCFSFHPRKAITTGEGGMITTNDPELAYRLRALRNHGQDPDALTPDFILPGFNYRMTEFQAALGQTQMRKLDRIIAARRQLSSHYDKLLRDTLIQTPVVSLASWPVYQSYVVMLPENLATQQKEFIDRLKVQGIEAAIGTWHIPLTNYYRTRYNYRPGDFPVTDHVFNHALTLPLYEILTPQEQETVIDGLINTGSLP